MLEKSKLNARNLVQGTNAWAAAFVKYSTRTLDWTKEQLQGMDRRTRNVLTMSGGFHRHGIAVRLYIIRKEGEWVLISV